MSTKNLEVKLKTIINNKKVSVKKKGFFSFTNLLNNLIFINLLKLYKTMAKRNTKVASIIDIINAKVKVKAELVGFVSAMLVFLSVFIGSLSAVTYQYVFLFWVILEALIAYIAGIIAGYSYFSMYKIKLEKK